MKRLRWYLACRLSRLACALRGHRWYVAANMADVPGNRAAELKQRIWEHAVIIGFDKDDKESLTIIEAALDELGQLAGENWGWRR